jgi:hypothetical protein
MVRNFTRRFRAFSASSPPALTTTSNRFNKTRFVGS